MLKVHRLHKGKENKEAIIEDDHISFYYKHKGLKCTLETYIYEFISAYEIQGWFFCNWM